MYVTSYDVAKIIAQPSVNAQFVRVMFSLTGMRTIEAKRKGRGAGKRLYPVQRVIEFLSETVAGWTPAKTAALRALAEDAQ